MKKLPKLGSMVRIKKKYLGNELDVEYDVFGRSEADLLVTLVHLPSKTLISNVPINHIKKVKNEKVT